MGYDFSVFGIKGLEIQDVGFKRFRMTLCSAFFACLLFLGIGIKP